MAKAILAIDMLRGFLEQDHLSVVGIMEYSDIVGGCADCASTAKASIACDWHMPTKAPCVTLVDTFETPNSRLKRII